MRAARPRVLEEANLGLTPLVDVVFLLLIFFVVATSFNEPQLALELPGAENAESVSVERDAIQVTITPEEELLVDGDALPWEELEAELAARAEGAEPLLELRAAAAAPHGRVVEVLDRARANGLTEVSIAVHAP